MNQWTLYHNPRCSKSRSALHLLQKNQIEPLVIEYLKEGLSVSDIKRLLKVLGCKPIEIIRKKEPIAKEMGLDFFDDQAVIKAIAKYPILLERPIIIKADQGVIGRPVENIETLLNANAS